MNDIKPLSDKAFAQTELQPLPHLAKEQRETLIENIPDGAFAHDAKFAVRRVVNTLEAAETTIQRLNKAKAANLNDPLQNRDGDILTARVNSWRFGNHLSSELDLKTMNAKQELEKTKEIIQKAIDAPIDEEAQQSAYADQIRDRLHSMNDSERMQFINDRLKEEDYKAVSVALGSPKYLTNFKPLYHEQAMELYKKQRFATEIKTIEALQTAYSTLTATQKYIDDSVSKWDSPQVQDAIKKHEAATKASQEAAENFTINLYR